MCQIFVKECLEIKQMKFTLCSNKITYELGRFCTDQTAQITKLLKMTISFIMFVSRLHGTTSLALREFSSILYLRTFRKRGVQIKVSLKSDKNGGHFT
jgi:hypothetical protein